jgi:hypothetical protein
LSTESAMRWGGLTGLAPGRVEGPGVVQRDYDAADALHGGIYVGEGLCGASDSGQIRPRLEFAGVTDECSDFIAT